MTDGPPSPPRLFISRESSLTLTELQRSLSAPTGGRRGGQLWEYGQQLKQKTFETDHFRVLYAKRQLRSAPAVLLFALVSIVAFYCAFEARWTEPYRLPIRFLPWMLLSALTFGISAISTLLLARLSVVRALLSDFSLSSNICLSISFKTRIKISSDVRDVYFLCNCIDSNRSGVLSFLSSLAGSFNDDKCCSIHNYCDSHTCSLSYICIIFIRHAVRSAPEASLCFVSFDSDASDFRLSPESFGLAESC